MHHGAPVRCVDDEALERTRTLCTAATAVKERAAGMVVSIGTPP